MLINTLPTAAVMTEKHVEEKEAEEVSWQTTELSFSFIGRPGQCLFPRDKIKGVTMKLICCERSTSSPVHPYIVPGPLEMLVTSPSSHRRSLRPHCRNINGNALPRISPHSFLALHPTSASRTAVYPRYLCLRLQSFLNAVRPIASACACTRSSTLCAHCLRLSLHCSPLRLKTRQPKTIHDSSHPPALCPLLRAFSSPHTFRHRFEPSLRHLLSRLRFDAYLRAVASTPPFRLRFATSFPPSHHRCARTIRSTRCTVCLLE